MKALHHVIRIEHKETGIGPFQQREGALDLISDILLEKIGGLNCGAMNSCHDIQGFVSGKHVCGVEYISQLQEWIPGRYIRILLKFGFKVYLHTLPKSKIMFGQSGKQVAFNKSDILETVVLYEH